MTEAPRRALLAVVATLAIAGGGAIAVEAAEGVRTVRLRVHHSSFGSGPLAFSRGETVRFVVENADPIDHEFILGDRTVQLVHERGTEAHHPPRPGEMSVPAGATRSTTFTFGEPGALEIGCHLPGHYAYGMRVPVAVA